MNSDKKAPCVPLVSFSLMITLTLLTHKFCPSKTGFLNLTKFENALCELTSLANKLTLSTFT